jgi:ribonuclease HII
MLRLMMTQVTSPLFFEDKQSVPLIPEIMDAAKAWGLAGIDEAGRGPWAGPVVAAAVILKEGAIPDGLGDSKKLTETARDKAFIALQEAAQIGVGIADEAEIERDNILGATYLAMKRAVEALPEAPRAALIDGNKVPPLTCPAQALVKGDGLSPSIAAASIIAKVTRDRIMRDLARRYPAYSWERNKGYGTAHHAAALAAHGITPHHRRGFKPIADIIAKS